MKNHYFNKLSITVFLFILCFGILSAQNFNVTLPQQCNPNTGGTETMSFLNTPPNANGDATLTIDYRGDLDGATEFVTFFDESGNTLGQTIPTSPQCTGLNTFTTTLPMVSIVTWASDGQIDFTAVAQSAVNNNLTACLNLSSFCVTATLDYPVTTAPNDIGVLSIDSPTVYCPGAFNVYATIQNYGTNQISSATVNWSVNGVLQTSASFSGLLDTANGSGNTNAQVLLGNYNFATNNAYTVNAWTTSPNGSTDTVTVNDSATSILQSSLPPPSNITNPALSANQATLSWTGGSANSWLWVNVLAGNPLAGTGTSTSSASVTVTGLTSETGYDFYVREVCPTGDTSAWAGPFFYKTTFLCPPNAYCFLTGGASGQFGPSQAQINTVYSGTPLSGQVVVNGGIQNWTVPAGGLYEIEVYGAQGFGPFGGRGAKMKGDFLLNGGDVLKILVGQKGAPPIGSGTNQHGGGGGTFVTDNANNPLIIAGGGGGSWASAYNSTTDASISTTGNTGANGPTNGAGGNAGQGGLTGGFGDGGGGLLGNGSGNAPGLAFVNGGAGGIATGSGGEGGFGGGGGCSSFNNRRCGGGGGYSGGGGAGSTTTGFPEAGGGGSFNAGTNQDNVAGLRFDDGVVIIRALSSGAPNDIGIVGIDSPAVFCPGVESVWASLNNFGTTQVTSATVNWSVDGVLQTPASFSGLLDTIGGTGNTTAQLLLGTFNFATNNPYNVSVWTSNPNGASDTVTQNDTASRVIQSSLPPPTGLAFSNLLPNNVDVTWNPGSLSNSWLWVVVPAGSVPTGVGTAVSSATALVSGINANTAYDFYVREVCPSGDTSLWAGPLNFLTPCSIYGVPFFENFDGAQWSLVSPYNIDQCWAKNPPAPVTGYRWQIEDGQPTSGTTTGPSQDVSGTGKYVYTESSSGVLNDLTELESPLIDISSLSAPQVEFFYHMHGATIGTMALQINDNGTWNTIWTLTGAQQTANTDPWIEVSAPFTTTSDTIQFRFQGTRGSSFTSDMAIDEVRVRDAPNNDLAINSQTGLATACGLGANESFIVEIENKGANTQSNFNIEYSINNGPFVIGLNVTTPLAFSQTQNYTINNVNLSGAGQKCIVTRVVLTGDEDPTNNELPLLCFNNLAVPSINSVTNGEVCNGGSVTMSATFTGDNLIWYDNAALTNQVNSGASYTASFSNTTDFYLRAENGNGCNSAVQTVTAEVNFTPTVNFGATVTNCTAVFTGVVSNNADSIRWTFGDGVGTSTAINPTYTYSNAQSFLVTLTAYDGTCSADTVRSIFVNCQVGLMDQVNSDQINIYPNPSSGIVNIEIEGASYERLEILDVKGNIVYFEEGVFRIEKSINLGHLKSGKYILRIKNDSGIAIKNLVIDK